MKKIILNKRVVFEFVSITFAVFLGLMLNAWKDAHSNSVLAENSLKNIRAEIVKNKERVSELLQSHKAHLITLDSLLHEKYDSLEVTNRLVNLKFLLISSTSWETAKITQAVAYMDLDLVTEVSGTYEYQAYYDRLVRTYALDRMTSVPEEDDQELLERMIVFVSSIVNIEENLIEYYNEFLDSEHLPDIDD